MLFESRCDAIFDVFPARGPPDLFALRLRLAGNGRLFDSNLLKFGWREFDSFGDAIAYEFAARGPPDLLLPGLRLARSDRLLSGKLLNVGRSRGLCSGRRECGYRRQLQWPQRRHIEQWRNDALEMAVFTSLLRY